MLLYPVRSSLLLAAIGFIAVPNLRYRGPLPVPVPAWLHSIEYHGTGGNRLHLTTSIGLYLPLQRLRLRCLSRDCSLWRQMPALQLYLQSLCYDCLDDSLR